LEYKTITKSSHKNHTILEPTLDITGIISLPKFEKSTTIPKKTIANLHMQIVNNQNYQEIINGLQQWLKLTVPPTLKTELTIHEAFNPCKFNIQSSAAQKAIALLSGAFKNTIEYKQKES
jgi:acetylornithine deacetylase/succinyl-diaminopimelate desuccinylase-like protein